MRTRNTLALLFLAAALVAALRLHESCRGTTRARETRGARLFTFSPEAIAAVTLRVGGGRIVLRRDDGQWRLAAPLEDRADSRCVDGFLRVLAGLEADAEINAAVGGIDLVELGLQEPRARILLEGPGAPPELLLGQPAAVEGRVYLRLADSRDRVWVVPSAVRDMAMGATDDFRDRRLVTMSADDVDRFCVKTAAGELQMTRVGRHWFIEKPQKARGDDARIAEVVRAAAGARIEEFVRADATPDPSVHGLGEPRGSIRLAQEGDEIAETVEIGNPVQDAGRVKECVYARSSARPFLCLLEARIAGLLRLAPRDLRDRKLLRLNLDTVDRVRLERAGRAVLLARAENGDGWKLDPGPGGGPGGPADAETIERLADALISEETVAFEADAATDLARFGLDRPSLRIAFSSYSSDTTAEAGAGEHRVATVSFGSVDGDKVHARVEEEPFIVSVRRAFVDALPRDADAFRALEILRLDPETIRSVRITDAGGAAPVEARFGRRGWELRSRAGTLDPAALDAVLEGVCRLTGREAPAQAVPARPPDRVLDLEIAGRRGPPLQLRLWRVPDGGCVGTAEGVEGAFRVGQSQREMLFEPVLEGAAPGQGRGD